MTEDENPDAAVPEAVPDSGIAPTPADVPPDYGNPGVADSSDPAWDEDDNDEDEYPDPDEPE